MNPQSSRHEDYLRMILAHTFGERVDAEDLAQAKAHIVSCPYCWRAWMMWAAELAPDAWEQVMAAFAPPFPQGPTFVQARRRKKAARSEASSRGIWQRGRAYLAYLSPEKVVRRLQIALDPTLWPSLSLAHRRLKDEDADLPALTIDDLPGLEAVVHVRPAADDPQRAIITVQVSMPERFPDFSGVRVQLDSARGREERTTGLAGVVTFPAIPSEQLASARLTIIPPAANEARSQSADQMAP